MADTGLRKKMFISKIRMSSMWGIAAIIMLAIGMCDIAKAEWTQGFFTDEFGDETKEKFIVQTTTGLFSNSATANEICYIKILISQNNKICINIQEYNQLQPYVYFIGDDSCILMKNQKGKKFKCCIIYKWNNWGGLDIRCRSNLVRFLENSSGMIKVTIHNGYSSVYAFKINADGFNNTYKSMKDARYKRKQMIETAQEVLSSLGFYNDAIDGLYGPKTEKAVKDFQRDYNKFIENRQEYNKEEIDGVIDKELVKNLQWYALTKK